MTDDQSAPEPEIDVEQLSHAWHLAETDGRTRYEYRWLYLLDGNDFQDRLCQYGRYGWEVVQLINHGPESPYSKICGYNVLMKKPYWIEQPNE